MHSFIHGTCTTCCVTSTVSQAGVGRSDRNAEDAAGAKPKGDKVLICSASKAHGEVASHQAMVPELVIPQLNLHFSITSINLICSRHASRLMHCVTAQESAAGVWAYLPSDCTCHR